MEAGRRWNAGRAEKNVKKGRKDRSGEVWKVSKGRGREGEKMGRWQGE